MIYLGFIILLLVAFVFLFIVSLAAAMELGIEETFIFNLTFFSISASLGIWLGNAVYNIKWEYVEKTCSVYIVEDIACINYNNSLININKELNQNLKEGDVIKVKEYQPTTSRGIIFTPLDTMEFSLEK